MRSGPLAAGEWVTFTDPKGRVKSILLREGGAYHTTKGGISHDDVIGQPDGTVATSVEGQQFLVLRPLLAEYTVMMRRGAAIIYPKEAARIIAGADIFPGARVLEAGVGSGALTLWVLRAIGPTGTLHSYERRAEFAEIARGNVETFLGGPHPAWQLRQQALPDGIGPEPIDRAILDMLAPWDCIDAVADRLVPGGILCVYLATTTQLGRVVETIRAHTGFTEPEATETMNRDWHVQGLAIRPSHGTSPHTGFLVMARKLAPGVQSPLRKRRPAPGAYGPDYTGPRPPGVPSAEAAQALGDD
ncbi:transposase [Parenemella sanctibonifatiensis]|uniref:tRNA (adenine(58)-N(1))-methyltransferase TrmI n=1 Tax=Parenemella sanctibonifatiensis TaxID=2016505 RepID=A0A255EKE2_9ACTN|nr:transposase [Parenemella sanctibonifatiensis]